MDTEQETDAIITLLLSGWVKELTINETTIKPWGDGWLIQHSYKSCDTYEKDDTMKAAEDFISAAYRE